MTMVAANGLVNLITPTCGAIMGGLALAKVEYTTWVKWAGKVVLTIAIANIIILTFLMVVLKIIIELLIRCKFICLHLFLCIKRVLKNQRFSFTIVRYKRKRTILCCVK